VDFFLLFLLKGLLFRQVALLLYKDQFGCIVVVFAETIKRPWQGRPFCWVAERILNVSKKQNRITVSGFPQSDGGVICCSSLPYSVDCFIHVDMCMSEDVTSWVKLSNLLLELG